MNDEVGELAAALEITRQDAEQILAADRAAAAERARRCCGKCRHWRPDPQAVVCDDGSRHPDGGWCKAPAWHTMPGPSPAMLPGDSCQHFEPAP